MSRNVRHLNRHGLQFDIHFGNSTAPSVDGGHIANETCPLSLLAIGWRLEGVSRRFWTQPDKLTEAYQPPGSTPAPSVRPVSELDFEHVAPYVKNAYRAASSVSGTVEAAATVSRFSSLWPVRMRGNGRQLNRHGLQFDIHSCKGIPNLRMSALATAMVFQE